MVRFQFMRHNILIFRHLLYLLIKLEEWIACIQILKKNNAAIYNNANNFSKHIIGDNTFSFFVDVKIYSLKLITIFMWPRECNGIFQNTFRVYQSYYWTLCLKIISSNIQNSIHVYLTNSITYSQRIWYHILEKTT